MSEPTREHREGAEPFIPGFPKELFVCDTMSATEFAERYAFVNRILISGLPHSSRAKQVLRRADRLRLPFGPESFLWRFTFDERAPSDPSTEITPCFMFDVKAVCVPVDFTDRSFAAAVEPMGADLDLSTRAKEQAYIATYYATSRTERVRQMFFPVFREIPCPAGVEEARWTHAVQEAGAFAAKLEKDPYAYVDRKEGEIVVFDVGYRTASIFGRVVPFEYQKHVILRDQCLIDKPKPKQNLWRRCAHEQLALSLSERRELRLASAREAIGEYQKWCPAGFDGDIATITEAATAMLMERRDRFPWVSLIDAGARHQHPGLRAELREFLTVVQARCVDYSVPPAALYACGDEVGDRELSDIEVSIRRRSLAFYPSHRLYEVLDRRGGRPRKTQFLFAPAGEAIPDAVDRLIPLNGVSPTHHMLNAAYGVQLTDFEAVEFLDFFCDTLTGGEGVFHLMETADDARWRGQAPEQRAIVADVATPIRVWPSSDQNAVVVDALLTYANVLFHAEFRVSRTGMVEMVSERRIFERLEIAPELFTSRTHFFLRPPHDFVAPGTLLAAALKQ